MFRQTSLALLASLAAAPWAASHRPLPSGVTCSSQFFSPETALTIPNPKVSWASYRIFTCDEPVFWLEAEASAGQTLSYTVTVPVIDRFEDVRMSVAFIGPGLPELTPDVVVPDEVTDYILDTGAGVSVMNSPQDQTTCDHLTADLMIKESSVVDNRCHFYEPFSGSNSWVVMDEELVAPEAGLYKIAVFVEGGTTAKASFACCDWPEDFVTNYDIPEPDCPFCGTSPVENPAWSSHFFEQKSMAEFGGFPAAEVCGSSNSLQQLPSDDQCPPVPENIDQESQPSSCVLGCNSEGECHSHNVFGECTHNLDWSLQPKFGDAPVSKLIIFKGDKINFATQSVHNLFAMTSDASLETCDFAGAAALADVEEITVGHTVTFDEAGTFYYSCGIGCTGFPVGERQGDFVEEPGEEVNPELCHCNIGQKLTVEVKDSSEGLRCHDHAQVSIGEATPLTCAEGEVVGRAMGNTAYGAKDDTECSEFCTQSAALQFMPGVEQGSCLDMGYKFGASEQSISMPGSPQDVSVRVVSNVEPSTCHCHSYEEIACPEVEAPDDTLYDEHIEEIEEYCTGVLDGSETSCPYKCFQPMEVLHLHYLECGSRPVDPTYIAVNATNLCHIAATAPEGAECPEVTLGGTSTENGGPTSSSASFKQTLAAWSALVVSAIALFTM